METRSPCFSRFARAVKATAGAESRGTLLPDEGGRRQSAIMGLGDLERRPTLQDEKSKQPSEDGEEEEDCDDEAVEQEVEEMLRAMTLADARRGSDSAEIQKDSKEGSNEPPARSFLSAGAVSQPLLGQPSIRGM